MTLRTDLWLFLAGLFASSVNAAAGGGTLLSFPSLLAAGLGTLAANATSTVALLPGYVASLAGYRLEVTGELKRDSVRAIVPSLIGGALGAYLLLALGAKVFDKVVPILLISAALLLVANPLISRLLVNRSTLLDSPAFVFVANFVIAVYAGYFGAGAGILFLAAMGLLMRRDLREVNAIKVLVSLLANVIAAATFVILDLRHPTGALVFRAAIPLAIGALVGGFVGVRIVRRLPPSALRAFAAVVGVAVALYLVVRRARSNV